MKAAKKIRMKPHNTKSTNKEANKKTSTSSNSDCDIDHKAATREVKDKVKGMVMADPILFLLVSRDCRIL
ncbi:hypothetical protein Hanom_Chr06g00572221 [Helianthus anomalus]